VSPRGRYEAVGKEGRLAAIISGALAGIVLLGAIVALIIFIMGSPEAPDDTPNAASGQQPAKAARTDVAAPATPALIQDCPDCPALVTIPAGHFVMGVRADEIETDNVPLMQQQAEMPLHGVTVRDGFAMGQTEVTRGQFAVFVAETGYQALGCMVNNGKIWVIDRSKSWRDPGFSQDDGHPVVCVSHVDATAYVEWLSRKTGKRYRLPTETEWEYAARAGTVLAHPWGDKPPLACAYAKIADRSHAARFSQKTAAMFFPCETGYAFTAPAAHYQANEFGLFDMYGNAREIVADCWNPNYWGKALGTAARTTGTCETAVMRGGGWYDAPSNIRPARRFREDRAQRRAGQGFRVVKELSVTVN
jgi:sulfatase modifying factor 1